MADGIVLVGLPGSGKSTVGRLVANRLGRPFIDLDTEIHNRNGRSPAAVLDEHGEAAFRAVEREAVSGACSVPGAVIATGGGAPLDPLNRWQLMRHGARVRLDADVTVLAQRLAADGVARPLLGDDLGAGLGRTSRERSAVYAAVDVTVDATAEPEDVAAAVIKAAGRTDPEDWRPLFDTHFTRHHPVGPERGRLMAGVGLTAASLESALDGLGGGRPATLADREALDANPALADALPIGRRCAIPGGEQAKTFDELQRVLSWLSDSGTERSDPLLVAGGGTLGDLGGLAAALHHRGMPLVHIPTTWLAQADSAIGGKVAIDLPGAKNAVGAFWPAWLIVSDFALLSTLPLERRRDGLVECLKAGLIGDAELWRLVEERGAAALAGEDPAAAYAITERAIRVKLAIVDRDPFERGERRVLNLGHTLGHALEVESRYTLAHGAAVALGLRAVAAIAHGRGADAELAENLDAVLDSLGFDLRRRFDRQAVIQALTSDKKRAARRQRWILPMAVGRVIEVDDVSDTELDLALAAIAA